MLRRVRGDALLAREAKIFAIGQTMKPAKVVCHPKPGSDKKKLTFKKLNNSHCSKTKSTRSSEKSYEQRSQSGKTNQPIGH